MKKTLLIAALTMMSAPAFASKARMAALGTTTTFYGSHTVASDIQQVFEQPSKMWDLADQMTIEFGGTGTTYADAAAGTGDGTGAVAANNTPNAEGGFIRSHDNAKWGAYIGHQSTSLLTLLAASTTKLEMRRMENPINLWYGMKMNDMNWGFNVYYASSKHEGATPNTKSSYGVSAGVQADKWNANAVIGLGAKATDDNETTAAALKEFKANSSWKLQGEYVINDNLLGYGAYTMFGGKGTDGVDADLTDLEVTMFNLGVESKLKSDMAHFFYGASINSMTTKEKVFDTKIEQMVMPVYFGVEADAASWLVLRAALHQNVLLAETKRSAAGTDAKQSNDSTVGSFGAGLKFGKLMIDGALVAGTTGDLNANNFMTNTSLTYAW
jgi:hypothetical protein